MPSKALCRNFHRAVISMAFKPLFITGYASLSPLGATVSEIKDAYARGLTAVAKREVGGREVFVGSLHSSAEAVLQELVAESSSYRALDRSTLLAIACARAAVNKCEWTAERSHCGVTFGSSRGATGLFEYYHRAHLEHPRGQVAAHASPTTTLGNLSSWVAQDLGLAGAALSHSSTCSSAIHSLANAAAWIRAGMAERFLAGGSEAPLTSFTVSQMQALGIYSSSVESGCACRPGALTSANTFVLGEGAACFAVESGESVERRSGTAKALARLESVGLGMEALTSPTSISIDADCVAHAMQNAIEASDDAPVDAIVLHAPGTSQGGEAELRAVRNVFAAQNPLLLSNKWLIGHTLGASGALSLEYALLLLQGLCPALPPYDHQLGGKMPSKISKVMVNSAGFGGNAASIIVSCVN